MRLLFARDLESSCKNCSCALLYTSPLCGSSRMVAASAVVKLAVLKISATEYLSMSFPVKGRTTDEVEVAMRYLK